MRRLLPQTLRIVSPIRHISVSDLLAMVLPALVQPVLDRVLECRLRRRLRARPAPVQVLALVGSRGVGGVLEVADLGGEFLGIGVRVGGEGVGPLEGRAGVLGAGVVVEVEGGFGVGGGGHDVWWNGGVF